MGIKWCATPLATVSAPRGKSPPCVYRGFCVVGCATNAKQSALVVWIPRALKAGAEVRDMAMVTRVDLGGDGLCMGVTYRREGAERFQRARNVVVAGYSVETPRLLLNSACPQCPAGLANSSGLVGKYLTIHSSPGVWATFEDEVRMWKGPPNMAMSEHWNYTDEGKDFFGGYSFMSQGPLPVSWAQTVSGEPGMWGDKLRKEMLKYNHMAGLGPVGETESQLGNCVELADEVDQYGARIPKITFSYSENDKALMRHGVALSVGDAGGRRRPRRLDQRRHQSPDGHVPHGERSRLQRRRQGRAQLGHPEPVDLRRLAVPDRGRGQSIPDHPGPGLPHRRLHRRHGKTRRAVGARARGDGVSVITSIFDLEQKAKRRLPRVIFEYVHGGSYEQVTLARNLADVRALTLRQRAVTDVSHRKMTVKMVGEDCTIPLAVGPTGLAGLTWPNGEVEAAKAAEAFGVPFCLSTMSISSIEDVAKATKRPFWFQLYLMKQRKVNEDLIRRAHDAGCSALVVTIDLHVQGKRWADAKNGLSVPPRLTFANMGDILSHPGWLLRMARSKRRTFGNLAGEVQQSGNLKALSQWIEAQFDPSFDADTLRWVRDQWKRKLILKGVMHPDGARQAIDLGADAIIVSNHGGRQLDGAPSSISVLPEIAEAVNGRIQVFFDGGLRTGIDIIKAMGRGADSCLSGRGWLYGLAANGEAGVACALNLFRDQLSDGMALTGVTDVSAVPKGVVEPATAL